jgi:hypothetical protein
MPVEDISNSLEDIGFHVINVSQLATNSGAPNGQTHVETFPLLLVTLTRNVKSQEMLKLNSLNHIIIKVESYRGETGLTQCYSCQNFVHVWVNCKQPRRCLWCGGGHLHRECPEKTNTGCTLSCCNCSLVEGQKPHPASYQGCSHMKGELQRRRVHQAPKESLGGRYSFSSPHHSSPTRMHCVKTKNASNHKQCRQSSSICLKRNFRKQVCQFRLPVHLAIIL